MKAADIAQFTRWVDAEGRETLIDNTRLIVETDLRERGVSESIIERVMRLNPTIRPWERLRGLRSTRDERAEMFLHMDAITKGEFIQRYGREAFDRIPKHGLLKRGRRVYVRRRIAREVVGSR